MNTPTATPPTAPWYIEGDLVCIPPCFYNDHAERDLPTPAIVRTHGTNYWISVTDPDTPELLDDASHYAHPDGPDMISIGLRRSASVTRDRLKAAVTLYAAKQSAPTP